MGDDQGGAALAHLAQRGLDRRLGAAVERAGGLVQDQDPRPGQQGAGDANPLALTAGQFQAALADPRVHPIRQALDKRGQLRVLDGGPDLGFAGLRPGERDIGVQGVVEQGHILGHQRHGVAQRGLFDVAQIRPVD